LGRLRRVSLEAKTDFFGCRVNLENLSIESDRVLAHAKAGELMGARELLARWDWQAFQPGSQALWCPGAAAAQARQWEIQEDWNWKRL
jgi:hypothetical protein